MRDLTTNSWGYRLNKKRDALAAEIAAYDNARDAGRLYFATFPELMLVEVSREGSKRFTSQNEVVGFLQGYIEARAQRDAYRRGE